MAGINVATIVVLLRTAEVINTGGSNLNNAPRVDFGRPNIFEVANVTAPVSRNPQATINKAAIVNIPEFEKPSNAMSTGKYPMEVSQMTAPKRAISGVSQFNMILTKAKQIVARVIMEIKVIFAWLVQDLKKIDLETGVQFYQTEERVIHYCWFWLFFALWDPFVQEMFYL